MLLRHMGMLQKCCVNKFEADICPGDWYLLRQQEESSSGTVSFNIRDKEFVLFVFII